MEQAYYGHAKRDGLPSFGRGEKHHTGWIALTLYVANTKNELLPDGEVLNLFTFSYNLA